MEARISRINMRMMQYADEILQVGYPNQILTYQGQMVSRVNVIVDSYMLVGVGEYELLGRFRAFRTQGGWVS
jgi:hypothetical protein